MEENQEKEFYPTWLLLVTGFSFLLFSLMLSFVDDHNIKLFWWIGGISFVSGLLTGAFTLVNRERRSNKRNVVP